LEWYEWIWIGLPVLLVFAGGLLGAIIGLVASRESARVLRGEGSRVAKFFITGFVTLGAIGIYLVLAVLLRLWTTR